LPPAKNQNAIAKLRFAKIQNSFQVDLAKRVGSLDLLASAE